MPTNPAAAVRHRAPRRLRISTFHLEGPPSPETVAQGGDRSPVAPIAQDRRRDRGERVAPFGASSTGVLPVLTTCSGPDGETAQKGGQQQAMPSSSRSPRSIFGTNFSLRIEILMRIVSNRACQPPAADRWLASSPASPRRYDRRCTPTVQMHRGNPYIDMDEADRSSAPGPVRCSTASGSSPGHGSKLAPTISRKAGAAR
jgi:hypothetical protein